MHTYSNIHFIWQLLASGEKNLQRSQSFQGQIDDVYIEKNPLAEILTTAHGVRIT